MILTNQGIFVPSQNLRPLISKFTYVHTVGFDKFQTKTVYQNYVKYADGIVVPKFSVDFHPSKILNSIQHPDLDLGCIATFSHNQNIIITHVIKTFNNYILEDKKPLRTGLTIVAPPGLGKTYIAIGLLAKFNKKTLYIVYDKKSLHAVYETLIKEFPNNKIGVYYGDKKEDGDIVVGIINSVLKMEDQPFGTVIYDEIAEYVGPERYKVFFMFNTCFNIGLTATPHTNGLERIYENTVGPILDVTKLQGYNLVALKFEGIVRCFKHKVIHKVYKGKYINFIETLKKLYLDIDLTQHILKEIDYILSMGKNLFVFSEIKSYINHISEKTKHPFLMLIGGATPDDYEKAKSASLIFTTYKFSEKALSLKHMDAILYITPRKSAVQSSGRITRMDSDVSSIRFISDIIHDCFSRQFSERKVAYKNFQMITVDF